MSPKPELKFTVAVQDGFCTGCLANVTVGPDRRCPSCGREVHHQSLARPSQAAETSRPDPLPAALAPRPAQASVRARGSGFSPSSEAPKPEATAAPIAAPVAVVTPTKPEPCSVCGARLGDAEDVFRCGPCYVRFIRAARGGLSWRDVANDDDQTEDESED